ncbi:fructosamine kinase family protein [Beggiatoa alba]|nr:fructosamine kinase family protein [Beggiatoa alba]
MNWAFLGKKISEAIAEPFAIQKHARVAGGCINTAYRIGSDSKHYFVKFNSADNLTMFEAEAEGLAELAKAKAVRVPLPICTGVMQQQSYIVMEYLSLTGRGSMADFAEQLVAMHRHAQTEFGWQRENTIGSTHQENKLDANWQSFWRQQRLGFQLNLAKAKGANKRLLQKGERLHADLSSFFGSYQPTASLLHGDLWSGNVAFEASGQAVIFDPATYYGDREADMAMTELFGGFSSDFYAHYQALWPLDDGYRVRKDLYNLYHILNHFNIFGGGYESQAEGICDRLLASI